MKRLTIKKDTIMQNLQSVIGAAPTIPSRWATHCGCPTLDTEGRFCWYEDYSFDGGCPTFPCDPTKVVTVGANWDCTLLPCNNSLDCGESWTC